jgi:hypothetical protein
VIPGVLNTSACTSIFVAPYVWENGLKLFFDDEFLGHRCDLWKCREFYI